MKKKKNKLQNVNLGNIAEINPPNNISEDFINYIDISSAKEGKVSSCKRFRTEDRTSRAQRKIKSGDIVISSVRPENKSYFFVNKNYNGFIASTGFVVIRPKIAYPRYLYYYLIRNEMINLYSINTGGSAYPALNPAFFNNLKIQLPPLSIQKKIASILSAYDDLIEVNERKIKIFEDMTKLIYKEWFVKFRFPGYEKVKMLESELGKIPEGWQVKRFTDVIEINPPLEIESNISSPFIDMKDLTSNTMVVKITKTKQSRNGSKFQNKDVLFARITPCLENGKIGFVQCLNEKQVGLGSTEFLVLRSKTLCQEFVYLLARTNSLRQHAIKSMIGASGRQRVQKDCFEEYKLAVPSDKIICKFESLIVPLFELVQKLTEVNTKLRQTRDMLLPKLVGGEIDVSDLDIKLGNEKI